MTSNLPATVSAALPATVTPLIVWQTAPVFGADGQFDGAVVTSAVIKPGASTSDLRAALAAVERSLQPCGATGAIKALGSMYATRRSRLGEQMDERAMLTVLAEKTQNFPRDVLVETGDHFIESTPWMPAVSEFLQIAERKARPRWALKKALEQAIARSEVAVRPQLEAPKPLPTQQERLRTASILRRQAGDTRTAARFEIKLAEVEKRPAAQWAQDAIAEQIAEQEAKAAEFQRVAEAEASKEKPRPMTDTDRRLAALAQERRDKMLGIDRSRNEEAA